MATKPADATIKLTPTQFARVKIYLSAKKVLDKLEETTKALRSKISSIVTLRERDQKTALEFKGQTVATVSFQTRSTFQAEKFATDHPDIEIEKYFLEGDPFPVLRVKSAVLADADVVKHISKADKALSFVTVD